MELETKIGAALLIFAILLTVFYWNQYPNQISTQRQNNPALNSTVVLTAAEIAKHNTQQDCWIIVESKVYDVTTHLITHPGGSASITAYCGKDATQAFLTKDGQGSHSQLAFQQLGIVYIGDVNGNIIDGTQNTTNQNKTNQNNTNVPLINATAGQTVTLTLAEVAKHNSAQDCWMIIQGKVYDVTAYASMHPGGSARIVAYCGQDATQAFLTKGGTGTHSATADQQHSFLYLGDVNGQANLNNTNNSINNISSIPRGEYEEDD